MPTMHRDTMRQLSLETQKLINDAIYHSTHLREAGKALRPLLEELAKEQPGLVQQVLHELDGIVDLYDNASA